MAEPVELNLQSSGNKVDSIKPCYKSPQILPLNALTRGQGVMCRSGSGDLTVCNDGSAAGVICDVGSGGAAPS